MRKYLLLFIFFCFQQYAWAQQTILLGVNEYGGIQNGTIFSYKTNSNSYDSIKILTGNKGYITGNVSYFDAPIIKANNGKFYSVTNSGGVYNQGTLYEYDTLNSTLTNLFDFSSTDGSDPIGLMQASNGKLYGVAIYGGLWNDGVIFEYDISTNTYTKKIDLGGSSANGQNPNRAMIQASNGKLYGMLPVGGSNNLGVIFEYDYVTNTYTKKIDLSLTIGSSSNGALIQAPNGKLLGLTDNGGSNNVGTIFEYDYITNICTKKIDFNTSTGYNPNGALILASNGKFYGAANAGGAHNSGCVFEYNYSTNTYTDKFDFGYPITCYNPINDLVQGNNGKFYGTAMGGANYVGAIFEFDAATNTCTTKFDFVNYKGDLGSSGSLLNISNNRLLGINYRHGKGYSGTVYEYNYATNVYTDKNDICYSPSGAFPSGELLQASNGNIYGTTTGGGNNGVGTIFKLNYPQLTHTKIFDFVDTSGINPGALIQATNGKLYGVTNYGGANLSYTWDPGVLFEYDLTTNTFKSKHKFGTNNLDFAMPRIMQANNGKLYGTTFQGGTYNYGCIYQFDIATNTYTDVFDFNGSVSGGFSYGSLLQDSNGKLYGLTNSGGTGGGGVLFEFDYATNTFTKKIDLGVASTGGSAYGSLMQASNGKLYGVTSLGGTNHGGILFEYDITSNTFATLYNFIDSLGSKPKNYGSLVEGCNGKLYGVTSYGGMYNLGTLYEFDYNSNVFTKEIDLKAQNGFGGSSLIKYFITPTAPTLQATTTNICQHDSAIINITSGSLGSATHWQWYKGNCTTGTAIDTGISIKVKPLVTTTYSVRSEGGCVPVGTCVSVTITVRPVSYATINKSICDNHPFYFNGHNLTISGTYYDTLTNYFGCDSFVTLNLTVLPTSSYSFNQTVCYNHPYNFNGTLLNISGIYHNTIPNHFGCDSFITLNLTVKPISNYAFNQTICSNHPYYFKNHWLNASGLYKDTLSNYVGCDSFVTLNLTVKPISNYSFTHKICSYQFYNFNNHNLNVSGTYFDTLVNYVGCDSFLTLHLIVLPDSVLLTKYICPGSPYNFNGTLITVPGTYRDSLTNQLGCDSIIVLHLFNGFTTTSNITTTICFNHPFQVGTKFYNQTGTYNDTIPNRFQCDSFITLHLTVKPISNYAFSKTICKNNPYFFNQHWLSLSGVYKDTLLNFVGCDSFATLNLTVLDSSLVILNETICNDHPYFFHHQYFNQSGIYNDTLQNYLGCDSTVILHLQVNISTSSNVTESVCSNRPYHFNHLYLDSSGIFHDTIPNHSGCDSTITLNLTMYPQHPRVTNVLGKLTAFGWGYDKLTWINCDNNQFVSSANPFDVNESGNYAVVVEQGNCSDTSACMYVDIDCHLLATPNPAKDVIHIKIKCGDKAFHLVLTDVLGRALIKQEIKNVDELELLRNELAEGVYFLYLYNEHDVKMVQKVVWE